MYTPKAKRAAEKKKGYLSRSKERKQAHLDEGGRQEFRATEKEGANGKLVGIYEKCKGFANKHAVPKETKKLGGDQDLFASLSENNKEVGKRRCKQVVCENQMGKSPSGAYFGQVG